MSEPDIETVKRIQMGYDPYGRNWGWGEEVIDVLPAIIAALEDRKRVIQERELLRKALVRYRNAAEAFLDPDDASIRQIALRAALEGRDD